MAKRGRKTNAKGRNEGEQYFKLPYSMAHSPAWSSLSGAAVKVFLELRTRFNGSNNGQLSLSMDEAARVLFIGKATVARAFEELEAKGFIVLTKRGHWYGRLASEWAITDRSVDGQIPTNAWRDWKAPASVLKRNERGPRKSFLGSNTEHIDGSTGPLQNRDPKICSATEPVIADSNGSLGSNTDRLYNHSLGREPRGEGAEARSPRERSAKATDLPPSLIGPAISMPDPSPMRISDAIGIDRFLLSSSPRTAGRQLQ